MRMKKSLYAATALGVATLLAAPLWMPPSALGQARNAVNSAFLDTICTLPGPNTAGQVMYRSTTGWTCLTPGTTGQVLTTAGINLAPSWSAATNATTGTSGATVPLLNGNNTYSGISTYTGGIRVPTRVITAAGAITVSASTDYLVCINKTVGAASAVALPAGVLGQVFIIDDCKGDAATNNITITPAAGNIDGSGTKVVSTNSAVTTIFYDGTQWRSGI